MKTFIMIAITLFFIGCGGSSKNESDTTPPAPQVNNADITPPASPTLE